MSAVTRHGAWTAATQRRGCASGSASGGLTLGGLLLPCRFRALLSAPTSAPSGVRAHGSFQGRVKVRETAPAEEVPAWLFPLHKHVLRHNVLLTSAGGRAFSPLECYNPTHSRTPETGGAAEGTRGV